MANLSFLHGGVHKGVMCLYSLELVEVIDKFILVSCSLHAVCTIKGELRSSDHLLENALVLMVS